VYDADAYAPARYFMLKRDEATLPAAVQQVRLHMNATNAVHGVHLHVLYACDVVHLVEM
jgi:hypothetical protein